MQFASLRVGVQELCDLAGSLTLVGDHGAKIRDTLSARASTLRRRQLADAEGKAGEADQSVLAQLLLALGVLILIGFPAVATSSPSKPREKRHKTPAQTTASGPARRPTWRLSSGGQSMP